MSRSQSEVVSGGLTPEATTSLVCCRGRRGRLGDCTPRAAGFQCNRSFKLRDTTYNPPTCLSCLLLSNFIVDFDKLRSCQLVFEVLLGGTTGEKLKFHSPHSTLFALLSRPFPLCPGFVPLFTRHLAQLRLRLVIFPHHAPPHMTFTAALQARSP